MFLSRGLGKLWYAIQRHTIQPYSSFSKNYEEAFNVLILTQTDFQDILSKKKKSKKQNSAVYHLCKKGEWGKTYIYICTFSYI